MIDEKLNYVVPIDTEAGTVYVHSTPISREVFERNFLLVSKTFARLYNEQLGATAAPRVAKMMCRQVAIEMNGTEPDGTPLDAGPGTNSFNSLMMEIRRLSNVVAQGSSGWETYPLQEAVDRKSMSESDLSEVENVLVFFTLASAMHRKSVLRDILDGAAKLWDAQITSSNSTDFAASLRTSTAAATSGKTAEGSSGPQ